MYILIKPKGYPAAVIPHNHKSVHEFIESRNIPKDNEFTCNVYFDITEAQQKCYEYNANFNPKPVDIIVDSQDSSILPVPDNIQEDNPVNE